MSLINLLRKIGVVILGTIVVLAFLELGVRLIHPHAFYPSLMYPSEQLGYILKPDVRGRATNLLAEFDVAEQANHEGFRDTDHPLEKPSHTYRIAFLGDSFTEAHQVEEKETFVRRIETSLRRQWNGDKAPRVECMNFGISGYDTQQEVLCYENAVRKYKPDMVVLAVYVNNDFSGNLFYLRESNFGRPYFRLTDGKLQKIEADSKTLWSNYEKSIRHEGDCWYKHLHLYNLQKDVLQFIRDRRRRKTVDPVDPKDSQSVQKFWSGFAIHRFHYYLVPADDYVKQVDAITRLLLQRLERDVAADGGRFCAILLPGEENVFPEKWPNKVKQYPGLENFQLDFSRPFERASQFLPDIAKRGDILDLRPAFREATAKGSLFLKHDMHYNHWGQESVANAVAPWLEKKLPGK